MDHFLCGVFLLSLTLLAQTPAPAKPVLTVFETELGKIKGIEPGPQECERTRQLVPLIL